MLFPLFISMAALAQEPEPTPSPAADGAEAEPERITFELIEVEGRVPQPEIQLVLSRPQIPVDSTERLMERIDERLAAEEEKR